MKRCTKRNYKNPNFWHRLQDGDRLTISDAVPFMPIDAETKGALQELYGVKLSYADGYWMVRR